MALVAWFGDHARDLPWRKSADPYHVWISEIMLQQTRVGAVLEYYRRFLEALPNITALAHCEEGLLMKLWQGLGYYNRARNLQKAAIIMVDDYGGQFPRSYEQVRALPGIGDYTAGAICSTVYNLPYPAVDGNVFRIMSRMEGDYRDISTKEMKKACADWVMERMLPEYPGVFNQALMELGAVLCLPLGEPLCQSCPVSTHCASCSTEMWRDLPVKPSKKARKVEERWVYLIQYQEYVAVQQRPASGLLASLWEFPNALVEEASYHPFLPEESRLFGRETHIFSHIQWNMQGISVHLSQKEDLPPGMVWVSPEELEKSYAIPSAFAWVLAYLKS